MRAMFKYRFPGERAFIQLRNQLYIDIHIVRQRLTRAPAITLCLFG